MTIQPGLYMFRNHKQTYIRGFQITSNDLGFTLVELMVTVAIIAIMAGFTFAELNSNSYKLKSAAQNIKATIQRGRLEAIKRNRSVTIDFDHNQDGTVDNNGFTIFDDENNTIQTMVFPNIDITPPNSGAIIFSATGTSFSQALTLTNENSDKPEYKITVHPTGRVKIEKSK